MRRRPPRSTRTDTLLPYTTLFRSLSFSRVRCYQYHSAKGLCMAAPTPEAIENARRKVKQRSEEHTSELQSLMRISYAVFCLKKKKKRNQQSYDLHYLYSQKYSTHTTTTHT